MTNTSDIALKSNNYFQQIFNKVSTNLLNANVFNIYNFPLFQCDKDKDGYITVDELYQLIETREYEEDIPSHVVARIHEMHDRNGDQKLSYEEFYEMINNPALYYIFGHYINRLLVF